MSDEEKKAIVELSHFSNMTAYWKQEEYTNSEIDNYITIILNLIEKQSKEIEEYKKQLDLDYIKNNYTSNDKIKAKIEVMNTNIINAKKFDCDYIGQCRFAKYILQSLLEEKE